MNEENQIYVAVIGGRSFCASDEIKKIYNRLRDSGYYTQSYITIARQISQNGLYLGNTGKTNAGGMTLTIEKTEVI